MFKIALEYVKKEKRNSFIIFFGISISIIMFFSLIQIGGNLKSEYKNIMKSYSAYDMYIDNLEYEDMANIHNMYKDKYYMTQITAFADICDGNYVNYVQGVDGAWEKTFMCDILEGTNDIGKNEIYVEYDYAEKKNITVGDTISLKLQDIDGKEIEWEFTVGGIVTNLPSRSSSEYFFVSMDTAREIISEADFNIGYGGYIEYFLIDEDDYPEEELSDISSTLFDIYGKDVFRNKHENDTKIAYFEDNKYAFSSLSKVCYLFVGFIVLVLVIFLYYILNLELERKRTQYGTMRALGMSQGKLIKITLYQLLIYGSVSVVIGIVGGYILNKFTSKTLIYRLMGTKVDVTAINPRIICTVVMVVLITILLVVFIYWLKVRKFYPIDYMHKTGKSKIKKSQRSKNIYWELIINNHSRNKANSMALGITIFLAAILLVVSMNSLSSINIEQEKTIFSLFESEVMMVPNTERDYFTEEEIELIEQNNSIYKQSLLYDIKVFTDVRTTYDCNVVIYDSNMMKKVCDVCEYTKDTDAILVSNVKQSGLEKLTIEDEALNITADIEIDEICENLEMALLGHKFNSDNILILDENYVKQLGLFDNQWIDIFTMDDIGAIEEFSDNEYFEMFDLGSILEYTKKQLRGMVSLVLYLLISIILLVVFLINSVLQQNFYQRKKEIGMLRALGICRKKMIWVLATEVVIDALLPIIISFGVTIPASIYVYNVIYDEIGTKLIGFIVGIPMLLLLIMAVALLGAKKCSKTTMMEMLRGDE